MPNVVLRGLQRAGAGLLLLSLPMLALATERPRSSVPT